MTDIILTILARDRREKELDDAFNSTENIQERMEIFMQMRAFASSFDHHSEIAIYGMLHKLSKYALPIIQTLLNLPPQKPELEYCFGKAALSVIVYDMTCFGSLPPNIPVHNNNRGKHTNSSTLYFASVYFILGSACYGLERYYESLAFLELAVTKLHGLPDFRDHCDRNCIWNLLAATHQQLYNLWVAIGKRDDEAILHASKALRYKELMLNHTDCTELGNAYFEAYKAYLAVKDVERAISLCLRTLEIYARYHGPFSKDVMLLRVDLVVMNYVRNEDEKAEEEHRIWNNVLVASSSEYLNAEFKTAHMLIHFGKYGEAIDALRLVSSCTDTGRGGQVMSLVKMANICCILGNFDEARQYMGEANRLEENEVDPIVFGNLSVYMSNLYVKMKDFDTAISLLKRVLEMAEYYLNILPKGLEKLDHQELFALSSAKLFSLYGRLLILDLAGWEKEEMLQFMIYLMKKLEVIFGLEHIEVGYSYARLGVALMKSGKVCEAVTLFVNAICIMDVSLGPHHMDSLRMSYTLYTIYVKQRRFLEAREIEAKITEGSKGLGPSDRQVVETLLDY